MAKILRYIGIGLLSISLVAMGGWKGYDILSPQKADLAEVIPVNQPSVDIPVGETPSPVDPEEAKKLIDVPYLHQNAYPTGCESVSAVMAMRYWGVDISVDDFIDHYLTCRPLKEENGQLIGPSPNKAFVGDPRTSYGFGCYAYPMGIACNKLLGEDFLVLNRTGYTLPELIERYIDRDIPVLVWATINMVEPFESYTWTDELDGSEVQWIGNEHCLVLVGYDDQHYYCNDPYNNNGVVAYKRDVLEKRYTQMGQMALVIRPRE